MRAVKGSLGHSFREGYRESDDPAWANGTPRRAISPCEGLLRPCVARAQKIIRLHPLSLLDRREQPFPIRGFHEGPDLAEFRRSLLAACHDIAWLSPLLLQRQIIVTGTPA